MTDYISREAANNALRECVRAYPNSFYNGIEVARTAIYKLPAADVREVKRGKWIDRDDDYYGWNMWACSACGEEFVLTEGTPDMNEYHFCPNCGARMEES